MKITRKYSPHHIVFETYEEYDYFWAMVQDLINSGPTKYRDFLLEISNEFSNAKEDM